MGDVAGAEEDDEIAWFGQVADNRRNRRGAFDVARVAMAAGADSRHQSLGRHSVDRLFACRIDRRHHHRVGIVEAGRELVEQIMQPGEAVRLGNGDDAALGGVARRLQNRCDLDRMVAVVVETSMPFHEPVRVKRRLTPAKDDRPLLIASAERPSSCATAIAAVALATL